MSSAKLHDIMCSVLMNRIIMKSLHHLIIAFALTTWVVQASPGCEQQRWEQFVNAYSKQLKQKLKEKSIPGAALSIVHREHGEHIVGIGVTKVRKGQKVTANTRFRLASVSKTFAGSLTAKLAAQGVLDIEDTVAEHLPIFTNSAYGEAKLYHLLSHSSGLVPNAYDNLIESRMSYDKIYPKLVDVEHICRPGICYGYQNVMFSLIGDVIKQSTRLSYESWLEHFFFAPLGMKDAGLGHAHMTKDDNFAAPHVRGKKRWHTAKLKPHYYKVAPAAGVNASAADMSQWLKAQLGIYPSVLSLDALTIQSRPYTRTKRELRRRVWRNYVEQAHYGLGWRIYSFSGELMYYHSGWVQGYRTDVAVLPELGIGFSLLLNAESGVINGLSTEFIRQAIEFSRTAETQADG
ncbi:serine hydrolase domain-containing protein [Pseudoalteromonas sp. R3]|uniref:serine hydrolase domain-containing protein n=2 Tax=Pseudoalteromonas sp. R3 TaxID=1709477 RepID=UPI000FDF6390|nr:serine hydrolase domain-containing protein [Pseudoalteromonas sp. R3]AZZ98714.1 class A beta-lactamase-related serine hydrolase [Pseudoalteromonas sp. R3]